jgi:hypothetical protein
MSETMTTAHVDAQGVRPFLRALFIGFLVAIPVLLGALYAVHNTDSHHWGFILGTALDFAQGKALFSEIFIQYGAGQPILLAALSALFPLTYTGIGVFGAVIYASTLVLLFLTVERLASTRMAMLMSTVAFLIHPYSIYPWPDYLAGFSLMLATYLLVRAPRLSLPMHATVGLVLFAAFLFRNTYIVNILAAGFAFAALSVINRRFFHPGVMFSIAVFALAVMAYLGFLQLQGNLSLWYAQNFGAATDSYKVGTDSIWRAIGNILLPNSLANLAFSLMIVCCGYAVLRLLFANLTDRRTDDGADKPYPLMVFISLLGAAGFAQVLMIYEVFRLQNACAALFVASAFWLVELLPRDSAKPAYLRGEFVLIVLAAMLATGFPSLLAGKRFSTWFPILEPPVLDTWSQYRPVSNSPILAGHRFLPPVANYYSGLSQALCSRQVSIVNLTPDATIPYLCGDSRNALAVPMFSLQMLSRVDPNQLARLQRGEYRKGEVVVAEIIREQGQDFRAPAVIPNPAVVFRALGVWERPAAIRWMSPALVVVLEVQSAPN